MTLNVLKTYQATATRSINASSLSTQTLPNNLYCLYNRKLCSALINVIRLMNAWPISDINYTDKDESSQQWEASFNHKLCCWMVTAMLDETMTATIASTLTSHLHHGWEWQPCACTTDWWQCSRNWKEHGQTCTLVGTLAIASYRACTQYFTLFLACSHTLKLPVSPFSPSSAFV